MTTAHLRELLSAYGYPLLFLASLIEGTGLPGPIELFFLASGVLIARHDMAFAFVWLAMALGNVVGNLAGYELGRHGGRPLFDWVAQRLHFRERGVRRAEAWFLRYGGVAQALSRWIGVTRTPAILIAGVMRTPIWSFVLGSVVGDGLWALFWTLVGVGIGRNLPIIEQYRMLTIPAVVLIAGLGVALWLYVQRRMDSQ